MKTHSSRKKGAIELSMTTIIVIVIGVALLSLGLMWVRGMFSRVEDLTTKSFEDAERILSGDEDFSGKISSSQSLTLKKGEKKVLVVRVRNINSQAGSFGANIALVESESGLDTDCLREFIIPPTSKNIDSNGIESFEVGFESARGCNPGSDFYKITVSGPGEPEYTGKTVTVRVE